MRKAAVLFPGIGYSVERPLLYYSGKMARAQGYDVIPVPYSGFPKKQAGSHDMLLKAFQIGRNEAEVLLKDAHLEACDDLIFFSKSIGTAVGASYADDHHLDRKVRHVLYTPVTETFDFLKGSGIAFHGTKDPWAENDAILNACRRSKIPLFTFDGANHSLEIGDFRTDIQNLEQIMETVWDYLFSGM